jgi:hypothetical protein
VRLARGVGPAIDHHVIAEAPQDVHVQRLEGECAARGP